MKIIDLLNKIANGEEVPKKIKFNGFVWTYDIYNKRYYEGKSLLFNVLGHYKGIILNDEVEILEEEKKIPEKIKLYTLSDNDSADFTTLQDFNNRDIQRTINWILDYLKSKGE